MNGMDDTYNAMAEPTILAVELVDALNKGVVRAIQTCGKSLPSSAIPVASSSPYQCEWTAFSTDLCCPAAEDLRQYFPPLDGSEVGPDGRPLLYAACLGLLLSKRDSKCNNDTPLSTFLSIASFLLDELKVDPNQPTQTHGACRRPPLHLVARACQPSAVELLVSRGADVNLTDDEGWSTLMACCMPDIPSHDQGGPTAEERVETLKILLRRGANQNRTININGMNYVGYTALHYACEGLNPRLIQVLLEDGHADATLRTVWGQSCIGIIENESYKDRKEAEECKSIIMAHLDNTGRICLVRSFLEEEAKAMALMNLINDVLIPASRRPKSNVDTDCGASQDERLVIALMNHLNLDPTTLYEEEAFGRFPHERGNLYEIIHSHVMALVPLAYQRVYRTNPSKDQREAITCTRFDIRKLSELSVDGVRHVDASIIMREAFHIHRDRGE